MEKKKLSGGNYFKEIQYYNKYYVWIILTLLFTGLVMITLHTYNVFQNEKSVLEFLKNYGFLLFADVVVLVVNIWAFLYLTNNKLSTKVSRSSVYYKKGAFKRKYRKIRSNKIESVEPATSDNLPKGTRKVIIKGKKGVLLKLTNKHNIFIGSQHSDSLLKAVRKSLSNLDK